MRLAQISGAVLESPSRLTPAVLQAADMLGLYQAELARILHLQCADIGRMGAVRGQLVPGTQSWRQALAFVRLYRALHELMQGDGAAMCHWLRVDNRALGGTPLLLMVDEDRIGEVLRHLQTHPRT